ncbi:H-NS family nucleoid-associated regulatory protein [Caballeronia sp. SBC1]|uniref:H-NS family nucleoid-associated regulatory protein n=1 Tax=Caballeronia sp. SBC1 TaxID=2705548 RepID=UPI00353043D7
MATAKPAAVKKEKAAGNYVRGPQLAKYPNPKTGATWSGRGPAPAWLAAAKDRSKFLIGGADAGSADAGSAKVASKKATAKKAVTAKTAGRKVAVKATQK